MQIKHIITFRICDGNHQIYVVNTKENTTKIKTGRLSDPFASRRDLQQFFRLSDNVLNGEAEL
ncbi:hypothetical protein P3S34_26285, partial [Enterobacter hormaechei]|uniref:hypothetical protein n=1 Tax=Enterobacter hormaechei TaxID=158836 RepID=UPI0023E383DC